MKYELSGVGMKRLAFELEKRGDLIFFEGPVLTHFIDEAGNDYFMRWTEMDDDTNRWLLFQVTKDQIHAHLTGKIPLLPLIQNTASGVAYFLDIDNDIEYKQIKCVEVGEIPDQYLPEEDAYFEMKYATRYARDLAAEIEDLIKNRHRSWSFWEIATAQLKNTTESNSDRYHGILDSSNDPGYFHVNYIYSLIDFPILLHRHANKIPKIQNLVAGLASTNDLQAGFLNEMTKIRNHNWMIDKLSNEQVATTIEKILESTHLIVQEHPDEYLPLYTEWKTRMVNSWKEISAIDSLLQNKFTHDDDDLADNLLLTGQKLKTENV